ncbi:MAG: hypothetical protein EOO63_17065 [Hymenobacter sp.]|nr:MAG: hypothetical protein EOO63_17065 [Hymenobacter sp.]
MMHQHRGEIVRHAVDASGFKLRKIYEALGKSRPTLDRYFDKPDLDWDIVEQIGEIIRHDFSQNFKELKAPPLVAAEPLVAYRTVDSLEDCQARLLLLHEQFAEKVRQYDELKTRYDALLAEGGK